MTCVSSMISAVVPFGPLAFINSPIGWAVIALLALLLFGRRLPGVARSLGQGINEFKKGLNDGSKGGDSALEVKNGGVPDSQPERPPVKTEIDKTSV